MLIVGLQGLSGAAVGLLVSAVAPDLLVGNALLAPSVVFFILMSGFIITIDSLPSVSGVASQLQALRRVTPITQPFPFLLPQSAHHTNTQWLRWAPEISSIRVSIGSVPEGASCS